MNKITAYLLIGCLILALLFNFAAVYDYTFDASTPALDLSEARDINAGLLSSAFSKVVGFFEKFRSNFEKIISGVKEIWNSFSPLSPMEKQTESDREHFEALYARSLTYVEQNFSGLKAFIYKWDLKAIREQSLTPNHLFYVYFHFQHSNTDIDHQRTKFGWTDDDCEWLHEYYTRMLIKHTYNGEEYKF